MRLPPARIDHGEAAGRNQGSTTDALCSVRVHGCSTVTGVTAPRCVTVRYGTYQDHKGTEYHRGLSAQSAGTEVGCMHRLDLHAGQGEPAHDHSYETYLYVISGTCVAYWGTHLERRQVLRAGDFFFIPPGVAHLPRAVTECRIILARSVPDQGQGTRLLPHLDELYLSMVYGHGR
jgi:uncharacterized RmlC-like cupin family protein